VLVCTHRRPDSLALALASLEAMEKPADLVWELVVIDNAPGGRSRQVAEGFAARLPLRYVTESRVGASYARNMAVAEGRHELLAFVDDDVVVDPRWLLEVLRAQAEFPEVGFFGGRVLPRWDVPQPAWYDAQAPILKDLVPHFDLGTTGQPLEEAELPAGANMIFRRGVLSEQPFRVDLGVTGSQRLASEETELFRSLLRRGVPGRYLPEAVVLHEINPERLTWRYLARWSWGYGRSRLRAEGDPGVGRLAWQAVRAAGHGARFGGALARRRLRPAARHLAEATISLGRLWEAGRGRAQRRLR
jgi:GT2 family glycosyltransferase